MKSGFVELALHAEHEQRVSIPRSIPNYFGRFVNRQLEAKNSAGYKHSLQYLQQSMPSPSPSAGSSVQLTGLLADFVSRVSDIKAVFPKNIWQFPYIPYFMAHNVFLCFAIAPSIFYFSPGP